MIYKWLRVARIVVSLAVFVLLGWAAVTLSAAVCAADGGGMFPGVFMRMQIVPALLAGSAFWLMFWTVVTLLGGRLYCSTVCPLGTLQDVVARLGHLRLSRLPMEVYRYHGGRPAFRVMAAAVLVEAIFLGSATVVAFLDPYTDFMRLLRIFTLTQMSVVIGTVIVAVLAVALSLRHGRLLCNTLCPVGAVLGTASTVSLLRMDINPDVCTHCGRCERVCKAECIDQKQSTVDVSRCVTCFDCTAACPDGAITWRVGRHRLQWPLLQSTQTSTAVNMHIPELKIENIIKKNHTEEAVLPESAPLKTSQKHNEAIS